MCLTEVRKQFGDSRGPGRSAWRLAAHLNGWKGRTTGPAGRSSGARDSGFETDGEGISRVAEVGQATGSRAGERAAGFGSLGVDSIAAPRRADDG